MELKDKIDIIRKLIPELNYKKIEVLRIILNSKLEDSIYEKVGLKPVIFLRSMCKEFNIPISKLFEKRGNEKVVMLKQFLSFYLYYRFSLTEYEIGALLNRDRCTILYHIKSAEDLLDSKYWMMVDYNKKAEELIDYLYNIYESKDEEKINKFINDLNNYENEVQITKN